MSTTQKTTQRPSEAADKPAQITTVRVYLEGGVIQDISGIPEGVEVLVIDQDEIECGENGHSIYHADETLTFGKGAR